MELASSSYLSFTADSRESRTSNHLWQVPLITLVATASSSFHSTSIAELLSPCSYLLSQSLRPTLSLIMSTRRQRGQVSSLQTVLCSRFRLLSLEFGYTLASSSRTPSAGTMYSSYLLWYVLVGSMHQMPDTNLPIRLGSWVLLLWQLLHTSNSVVPITYGTSSQVPFQNSSDTRLQHRSSLAKQLHLSRYPCFCSLARSWAKVAKHCSTLSCSVLPLWHAEMSLTPWL